MILANNCTPLGQVNEARGIARSFVVDPTGKMKLAQHGSFETG